MCRYYERMKIQKYVHQWAKINLDCVQGMSFIAAILLLNLEEADAFIVFANLVNRPLLAAFYRVLPTVRILWQK